jgi:hypothetical protein
MPALMPNVPCTATIVAIVLAPVALGLVLARLIPWRLSATDPLAGIERERIRRELWWLVGLAVAFPALTAAMRAVGVAAARGSRGRSG